MKYMPHNEFIDVREFSQANSQPEILDLLMALGKADPKTDPRAAKLRNNVQNLIPKSGQFDIKQLPQLISLYQQDRRNLQSPQYTGNAPFVQGQSIDPKQPYKQTDSNTMLPIAEALLLFLGGKGIVKGAKTHKGAALQAGGIASPFIAPTIADWLKKAYNSFTQSKQQADASKMPDPLSM